MCRTYLAGMGLVWSGLDYPTIGMGSVICWKRERERDRRYILIRSSHSMALPKQNIHTSHYR